jgi:hypothetical protein
MHINFRLGKLKGKKSLMTCGWGCGGTAPRVLNFGIIWSWSFTQWSIYALWYPLKGCDGG